MEVKKFPLFRAGKYKSGFFAEEFSNRENLYSETDTEVRYTVEMFECEEGENIPNTMGFMLLPKRIDGVWYLCVGGRSIIR